MDDLSEGDLVFLTQAYERFMFRRNPKMKVSLVNRLARLEEIIDWTSSKGRKIKAARIKSGKWRGLPLEDNRYIFSVFYPDLMGRNGQKGVISRGVPLFSKDPKTGDPFFQKVPEWFYREIARACDRFDIELR